MSACVLSAVSRRGTEGRGAGGVDGWAAARALRSDSQEKQCSSMCISETLVCFDFSFLHCRERGAWRCAERMLLWRRGGSSGGQHTHSLGKATGHHGGRRRPWLGRCCLLAPGRPAWSGGGRSQVSVSDSEAGCRPVQRGRARPDAGWGVDGAAAVDRSLVLASELCEGSSATRTINEWIPHFHQRRRRRQGCMHASECSGAAGRRRRSVK